MLTLQPEIAKGKCHVIKSLSMSSSSQGTPENGNGNNKITPD